MAGSLYRAALRRLPAPRNRGNALVGSRPSFRYLDGARRAREEQRSNRAPRRWVSVDDVADAQPPATSRKLHPSRPRRRSVRAAAAPSLRRTRGASHWSRNWRRCATRACSTSASISAAIAARSTRAPWKSCRCSIRMRSSPSHDGRRITHRYRSRRFPCDLSLVLRAASVY